MTWLDRLMEETSESESPKQFIYWSGLVALAAAARKNTYLNRGGVYTLYPNIYVLLVADSGIRKSYPIFVSKTLLEYCTRVRVISGRNSIQAVIKDLGTAKTVNDGGPPLVEAHALLSASEFSTFIIEDPSALTILTDLYDTHYHLKEWRNTLKGTGVEVLKEPCLTMFGATSPAHFRDRVGSKDLEGGFIARTIIVYSDKKGRINPLVEEAKKVNLEKLVPYLLDVTRVKGEFKYTNEGKAAFLDWYNFHEEQKHDDRTGTANRLHDHILKVAMLLSLAENLELLIDRHHIEYAVELCSSALRSVNHIVRGAGKSQIGPLTQQVAVAIFQSPSHRISRATLLRTFYGDFDAITLDNIIGTLTQAQMIEVLSYGNGIHYQMRPEVVELWKSIESAEVSKRQATSNVH